AAAIAPARVYPLGHPADRVAEAMERYGARMPATWWMPPSQAAAPIAGGERPPELVARPRYFGGLRYLGQLHRTYLVCEGPQGLVLIDQHAALERLRDALLARAACHGSVRAHDALTAPEAQALLDALDETDYGARCAHGRPVVAEWTEAEIERRFGRDYASHARAAPPEAV